MIFAQTALHLIYSAGPWLGVIFAAATFALACHRLVDWLDLNKQGFEPWRSVIWRKVLAVAAQVRIFLRAPRPAAVIAVAMWSVFLLAIGTARADAPVLVSPAETQPAHAPVAPKPDAQPANAKFATQFGAKLHKPAPKK